MALLVIKKDRTAPVHHQSNVLRGTIESLPIINSFPKCNVIQNFPTRSYWLLANNVTVWNEELTIDFMFGNPSLTVGNKLIHLKYANQLKNRLEFMITFV